MGLSRFASLVAAIILLTSLLSACGGGGGGSGNNNGISVNTSAINFAADSQGAIPASKSYTVSWTNSKITGIAVGVPQGQTVPSWVDISLSGTSSPLTLTIGVNTTNLPGGTYGMTLRIVSGDANANIINYVDIPVSYIIKEKLTSTTSALSFSYTDGSPTPPAGQSLQLNGNGIFWVASISQPWVTLSSNSGTAPQSLTISVDPTGMAVGSYSAVITFSSTVNPADTYSLDVSLQITSPVVQLNTQSLSFSGINGSAIASQAVAFTLNNQNNSNWTVTPSDPWISLNKTSFTTADTVTVSVDPATPKLASGSYSGSITFATTYMGNSLTKVIPITLSLTRPTLTVTAANLDFQGGPASDFVPQPVSFSINTGALAYPWSINLVTDTGSGWLVASNQSGTVSQTTQSSDIGINTINQVGAQYTGSVNFSVTVNGDVLTQTLPVTLVLEPHRLFVADNGVALLSSPGQSVLSRTVTVSDNRKITTPWTAVSDQAWLTVTSSGTTDGGLVLQADPTSLAAETIHYANVTISSTDTTIVNSGQEVIRVGFYITNTTPASQTTVTLPAISGVTGLVADPVRPYVYVTESGTDIEVYNIYTGALVNTISNAGADLRNMAVSTNGDTLYALDYTDNSIVSVDLTAATPVANPAWTNPVWSNCSCSNAYYYSALNYTRINGKPVLVGGGHDIIDALTGERRYPTDNVSFIGLAVVADITPDGTIMFTANTNSSGHAVNRYLLKYSEINNAFTVNMTHSAGKSGFNRGLSSNPAGDRVYRACWYSNEMEVYNGNDLSTISSISSGTNGGALFGPDGLIYCARYYSDLTGGSGDVWSVNPADNSIVSEFSVTGEIETRMYVISGDGKRLITRSNGQATLTMSTIP